MTQETRWLYEARIRFTHTHGPDSVAGSFHDTLEEARQETAWLLSKCAFGTPQRITITSIHLDRDPIGTRLFDGTFDEFKQKYQPAITTD